MNKSDCIIPVFVLAMLEIIDFNTIFIVKHMHSYVEIYSMFRLIGTILFFIPFKFQNTYIASPALLSFYFKFITKRHHLQDMSAF